MLADDPKLKPQYRMPRVFGALPGPRNVPKDRQHLPNRQRNIVASVTARADPAALEALLPPGCRLDGEPLLTVNVMYLYNIGWLAGRGYNLISVAFPIAHGERTGLFVPVVWENLADPILTGREELGWAKLYADIPEPLILGDACTCQAGWMGFPFLRMELDGLADAAPELPAPRGQFHHKYVPRTGSLGEADVDYLEYAPAGQSATGYGGLAVQRRQTGSGTIGFSHARWEDVPFQYPILNALADIRLGETVAASLTWLAADGAIGDPSAGALQPI